MNEIPQLVIDAYLETLDEYETTDKLLKGWNCEHHAYEKVFEVHKNAGYQLYGMVKQYPELLNKGK